MKKQNQGRVEACFDLRGMDPARVCKFETVFACVKFYFFKLLSRVLFHRFPPLLDEETAA